MLNGIGISEEIEDKKIEELGRRILLINNEIDSDNDEGQLAPLPLTPGRSPFLFAFDASNTREATREAKHLLPESRRPSFRVYR